MEIQSEISKKSPDGRRVATVDTEGLVVLDGVPQAKHGLWVEKNSLTFSPDSKRLAYIVRDTLGESVVVDGIRHRAHGWVNEGSLVFSPDSRHFAYVVRRESSSGRHFVVVDGRKSRRYDEIKRPVFTPDSKFLVYVAANEGPWTSTLELGYARFLTYFYLVVQQCRPGMLRSFVPGRSCKRFTIDGSGWLFPEVSADSRLAMAVDRNNGKILLTVNLESEF